MTSPNDEESADDISALDPLASIKAIPVRALIAAGLLLAIVVLLGGLFRHHLHWGDFPTWVLAITTLLALFAAAFAALVTYELFQIETRRDIAAGFP